MPRRTRRKRGGQDNTLEECLGKMKEELKKKAEEEEACKKDTKCKNKHISIEMTRRLMTSKCNRLHKANEPGDKWDKEMKELDRGGGKRRKSRRKRRRRTKKKRKRRRRRTKKKRRKRRRK